VGPVVGHGRVLKRGSDVCFLAGELFQDGKRIASATATALIRSMPAGPDAG
jgi:acyl-coenzyme A thioesterase PaaI-like protein